jgi:hypothetical protein
MMQDRVNIGDSPSIIIDWQSWRIRVHETAEDLVHGHLSITELDKILIVIPHSECVAIESLWRDEYALVVVVFQGCHHLEAEVCIFHLLNKEAHLSLSLFARQSVIHQR